MTLTKLKIEQATFKDLSSSKDEAAPGEEVELQVTAENLPSGQKVQFELRDSAGFLGTLEPTASGTTYKKKWNVPNGPGDFWIKYAAVLRETPSPKNGHLTIVRRLP